MAFWSRWFGSPAPRRAIDKPRPRIFISYGHDPKDQAALVRKIGVDLQGAGHDVWFDESKIRSGDAWRRSIMDGIQDTDWVLVFLSAHAMRAGSVCLDEIALAMAMHRNIATILLEPERDVRVPVSIGHIQWLDMSAWRGERAKGRRTWRAWYGARLGEIAAMLADPVHNAFKGEIRELARRLKPMSQSAMIARLVGDFVGREWLATQVNNWRLNQLSQRQLLLTAAPGMGKSAFAAWLTHFARANVVGLTLSRADDPESRTATSVVRTLAFQAAARLPDYRVPLLDLLRERDPDGTELAAKDAVGLFRFLLTEPLRLIDGGRSRDRFLLVVDGLDETLVNDRSELADLFARHGGELPDWMAVLLTSREEHEIERSFSYLEPLRVEHLAAENLTDLRAYASMWLSARGMTEAEHAATLDRVCEAADGNFLYLTVLKEEVENGRVSLALPAPLPPGLNGLYRSWMDRQFPDHAVYDAWRELLGLLAVATTPVPETLLGELLGWNDQRRAEMLEQLGALFERRNGTVAPFHASLRAWLTDEKAARSDFMVHAEAERQRLADALWTQLLAWTDHQETALEDFLISELPSNSHYGENSGEGWAMRRN